ncbi:MAG: hypothetical protein V9F03_07420 [Microthrixaceae bacterium]
MTPPHVIRIAVAAVASLVLTSTVVGPLAYGAHSARLERQIVRTIKSIPGADRTPETSTTSTVTSTTTSLARPSVLDKVEERESPKSELSPSPATGTGDSGAGNPESDIAPPVSAPD